MRKILVLLLLIFPFVLQATYKYDETFYIPLEQTGMWKQGKQTASKNGASLTRFLLESETQKNWSKLLTIQFKDRNLVNGKTALEAMVHEQELSPVAKWDLIETHPNDVVYARSFPTGEYELVRMVMTKKGLHRAAYLKRGPFTDGEKALWVGRLLNGVVGSYS